MAKETRTREGERRVSVGRQIIKKKKGKREGKEREKMEKMERMENKHTYTANFGVRPPLLFSPVF